MSAQPAPDPPNVAYQSSRADEFAFKRRRNHAQIEAMTGRILQAVCYPTKRHRDFICALQAAHGGGEDARIPFTTFRRAHLTLAKYMQVGGSQDSQRKFIYREIVTLQKFTRQTGILLFHVTPGSEQETTEYVDYLTPAADAAMQRALSSPLWKNDKPAAVDEAVKWAVEQLPRVEVEPLPDRQLRVQSLDDYLAAQTDQLLAAVEKRFDGIEERHGDAGDMLALIERVYAKTRRAIESRRRTAPARCDLARSSHAEEDTLETPSDVGGDGTESSAPPAAEGSSNATSDDPPPQFASKLDAALTYANHGWRILPLHTPRAEGHCSCRGKKKCHVGKHPRTLNGVKDATIDPEKLRYWWGIWPDANVGVAAGVESGIVVLDVDPRHGGDVSVSALIEEHGEWPRTLEADTGGGGKHVIFQHPGVAFKNSASVLGEGLDIKTDGGYIVAAPSLHVSGGVYRWSQNVTPSPMPGWMIAELTREQPPTYAPGASGGPLVITADGPPIPDGRRNRKLFEIACALRGKGAGREQLLEAMRAINLARCKDKWGREPLPLGDEEVTRIVESALRYEPNAGADSE